MGSKVTYSVIVPVWNGEKTLRRCLDSLIKQNRQDIEILVVDDGSTDKSLSIAREYAARYSCVLCISQDNGGVSRARNAGLEIARGVYITFVDCDDYVMADYFTALDQAADCDLLMFGRKTAGGEEPEDAAFFSALAAQPDTHRQMELLLSSRKIMPPWNKRFRRDLIEDLGLRFVEGLDIAEDFCFCFSYALRCKSIAYIPRPLCVIDISDGDSLSRKYHPQLAEAMCRAFHIVAAENGADSYGAILDWLFARSVFGCIAQEWKNRQLYYPADRGRIHEICNLFRTPLSSNRCGMLHRMIRWLLKCRWDYPLYLAAYWGKGRKLADRRKRR